MQKRLRGRYFSKHQSKLTLIPLMDIMFILSFFLLFSTHFVQNYALSSSVPLADETLKNFQGLTLNVSDQALELKSVDGTRIKKLEKNEKGSFNLSELTEALVKTRTVNPKLNDILLIPKDDLPYEELISIMDAIRLDRKKKSLYTNIYFGELDLITGVQDVQTK